jgi:NitT/TauT family transport system permease protein
MATLETREPLTELVDVPSSTSRARRWWRAVYPSLLTLAAILGLWQLIGSRINPIFLSTPVRVAEGFRAEVSSGQLPAETWLTLKTFVLGLLISLAAGIPLGLLFGRYQAIRRYSEVAVRMFYSVPAIAMFPLFILWFGVTLNFRLSLVVFASVFPVIINAQAGVQSVDALLLEVATVFGAKEREMFSKIVVPASVPFIAAGFKIAIGRAIVTTVTLELLTTTHGLGGLMGFYGSQFQTADYFGPLIVVIVISLAAYSLGDWVEKRFSRWRPAPIT